jgi:pyruvate/2-oxoglutarate dehydrogenase complex dihydrolipoamide dehydrogenase (E3) component
MTRGSSNGKAGILVTREPAAMIACSNSITSSVASILICVEPKIDIDAVRKNKDDIVSKLTSGIKALAKARGVQVITGYGRFVFCCM